MIAKFIIGLCVITVLVGIATAQLCDTPPSEDVAVRKCCKVPKLCGDTTAFKCRHLTNGNQKPVAVKPSHQPDPCLIECLFNALGVAGNGAIKRDALLQKYTSNANGDPELIAAIGVSIDECVGKDGLILESGKPPNMTKQECDPNSALVFSCIYRRIYLRCPPHLLVNSEPCNKFRTFTAECPTPSFE